MILLLVLEISGEPEKKRGWLGGLGTCSDFRGQIDGVFKGTCLTLVETKYFNY